MTSTAVVAKRTRVAQATLGASSTPPPPDSTEPNTPSGPRRRESNPPPVQLSLIESAHILAYSDQFWAAADQMPRNSDVTGMRGRKPKSPDYVKLLLVCASWETISMLALVTALSYPPVWKLVRAALDANRPEGFDPAPEECPSVSQMKSFNARLRDSAETWREEFATVAHNDAVALAQRNGYLDPARNLTWAKPDPRDFVATDGTVMRPCFGSGHDDSVGPQIVFNDETAKNKPTGSKILTTFVHGDLAGSRIITRIDAVPPGPNGSPGGESPVVDQMARAILEASNGGLKGVIVDSVIRGRVLQALSRDGVVVVNYPHAKSNPNRTEGGRHAEGRIERTVEVEVITHTVKGKKTPCEHPLLMVGSVPSTRALNEVGEEVIIEVEIRAGLICKNKNSTWRYYHKYVIPCIHGNFIYLYRLFPTDDSAISHGESTRFFPTNTQQFSDLYGRRNATESWHRELKRNRDRMPVRGLALQSIYLIGLMVLQNAKTMERMRRAGAAPPHNIAA